MKLISVIMSVHNGEKYLNESIQSILNQTFEDFEFLILDDDSTDNSYEIINNFSKTDNRIKIYRNQKNLGLTKSLNYLIDQTKNEIIARQDADDFSERERFHTQIKYLTKEDFSFCITRAKTIQKSRLIPKYSIHIPSKIVVKYKNPFIHGTLMIKKKILLKYGKYDENFYLAQDYKLFKNLLDNNERGKYIKKVYYNLNTENNISSLKSDEQKYYSICVRKNLIPKNKL